MLRSYHLATVVLDQKTEKIHVFLSSYSSETWTSPCVKTDLFFSQAVQKPMRLFKYFTQSERTAKYALSTEY